MQVTEHIHALRIPFSLPDPSGSKIPRFVYVYLIYGEKIYLIDSGVACSAPMIFDYLQKTGSNPKDISYLILTHSHPDHIGAAAAVQKASGCTVAAHATEIAWIQDVDLQYRERPVPGFQSLVGGSVQVDRALQDGDLLDLGDGLSLEVIHTPGHSKGSISLWFQQDAALFSADAIPVPGEMPIYEDLTASVGSIERLEAMAGIKILLAAWDEPRQGEQAYRSMDRGRKYLQHIHEAVLKIAGSHRELDPMELCRRVLAELGMPVTMANPLIARSFQASLNVDAP